MANEKSKKSFIGEEVFLTRIKVPQGLLFILVVALFVFVTENQYYRLILYALVIYYLFIWILVMVRDAFEKSKKPPIQEY